MATVNDHIRQWQHNRGLLRLLPLAYPDWIVTVAFYTSLQSVDAVLKHDGHAVTSHDQRNTVLLRTNRYLAIRKSYLPLYGLARTVRYLADPAKWVPAELLEANVIARYLYPIEKSVQTLLGQDLDLPKVILAA